MVIQTLTHGRYRTNTYVAGDEVSSEALLIDPTEDPEGCIGLAEEARLRIVAIISTHSHFDHIGGVAGVCERLRVPFLVGVHALDSLRAEAARAAANGIEIPSPPEPDRLLGDGDQVKVGTLTFEVLYTPGHWRGDICLYVPAAGVVFTGDSLHRGEVGRYNQGCDEAELLNSIRTKLMPLPDATLVYSGHGAVTTIGAERSENRALQGLPRFPPA